MLMVSLWHNTYGKQYAMCTNRENKSTPHVSLASIHENESLQNLINFLIQVILKNFFRENFAFKHRLSVLELMSSFFISVASSINTDNFCKKIVGSQKWYFLVNLCYVLKIRLLLMLFFRFLVKGIKFAIV